jgi:alkyl hydroperoxide reductase subunit AhpC
MVTNAIFEVLKAVLLNMQVLQDAPPCRLTMRIYRLYEGRCCFHSIFIVKQSKKLKAQLLYEKSTDVYISTRHNISEALQLKASEPLSCVKEWDPVKQLGCYESL